MKRTLIQLGLLGLVTCSGAAGQLVGITSNSLVVINPTNLAQVSVIGTFTLPQHIEIFPTLTYHRGSCRLYAYGIAISGGRVTNQYLLAFNPDTAAATVAATLNSSYPVGGASGTITLGYEALEYVNSIGDMVATSFSGSFVSSNHVRMAEDGTTTFLVSNGIDNDQSVYDPVRDIYYNADANDSGQLAQVNLSTGTRQNIGSFGYADMAFSTGDDAIYVLGFPDRSTLRRIRTTDGGAPITTTTLGTIPGPMVLGIAYVDEPGTHLSIRVSQVEICWSTRVGRSYQLQYRSDLTGDIWTDLGTPILGDGATKCATDSVLLGQPRRFYRVCTLP